MRLGLALGLALAARVGAVALPAPTISSVSPSIGPKAGGTTITINGTGFVSGCTVTIGGVSADNIIFSTTAIVCDTHVSATYGAKDVVVTNPDTQAVTSVGAFTYSDLLNQALTLCVRAPYAGSPWVGTTSNGTSGTRNLTGANPPSPGTTVDGFAPAVFDAVNDQLSKASPLNTIISATAGTFGALINMAALESHIGPDLMYFQPALLTDSGGNIAFYLSDAGWTYAAFDGAAFNEPTPIAITTGQWVYVQARWNNTTCEIRKNGGAWTTKAMTIASGDLGGNIIVGTSYNGGFLINGRVLEQHTMSTRITDAAADLIYAELKARYPSAGLP